MWRILLTENVNIGMSEHAKDKQSNTLQDVL